MFAISSFSQSSSPKQFKSIVMDCSTFSTPKLSFFRAFLLFIIFPLLFLNIVSGTATELNYGRHCNSVVHESAPGDEEFNNMPFPGRQNGYFSGGDNVLSNRSVMYYPPESKAVVFETHHVYATDVEDVFKVEGNLIFKTSYYYEQSFNRGGSFISSSSDSRDRGILDFDFHGFWSRTTGKLCMVGSSYTYSDEGKLLQLEAVLKINNLKSSSNISTLVTGTIASLKSANDPNYFEKISLLMFPQVNYGYTISQGCPLGTDVQPKLSLSLSRTRTICDMLSGGENAFELEYASGCDSSKSCSPFGDNIGYLPPVMSLSTIQCSADGLSLRFLIEFRNNSYRGYYICPNIITSLIGEGTWDAKSNRLCIAACRIYDASSSLETSRVRDCTTRLSLRFPAVLSIRRTGTVVGEIWSLKKRNEAGFFDRIEFRNTGHYSGKIQLQGLKYEYTEMDKVKKSCPKKNPRTRSSRVPYPDAYSGDMGFRMSFLNGSKVNIGWGSSDILTVGDQSYQRFLYLIPSSSSKPKHPGVNSNSSSGSLNVSYKMRITLPTSEVYPGLNPVKNSSNGYLGTKLWISAEGIYDTATGSLCMVGCSRLMSGEKSLSFSSHSMDCEILVNVYFPPRNSDRRSKIKGSIESMRKNTDHLYFTPMQFSGWAHYHHWITESMWRMNFEMIMSVISNTLAIIFAAFQIFHVRKQRGAGPLVSLLMLVILALGHLIPLVLNLEAMFEQDSERSVLIRGGTWIEMNEVIIRVFTMVAFLLQIRLLMLSWTARCSTGKKKALWTAEKRGLYVCFPVYITGAMISFFIKSRQSVHQTRRHSWYYKDEIILGSSRTYAGLILDVFLFPQIIFNMLQNSREPALSRFYYIGITVVRLLPHGYDLYRANTYADIEDTYIYADHAADYYSTAWDFIIIVLGLFFAATIHYQQRLGGRCFLPKRFQESVIDEELSVDSEEQLPLKYST